MFAFRILVSLAAAASVLANPLASRQATNTNARINTAVSNLDVSVHKIMPTILTLMANHTASDGTIGAQINNFISAFNTAESSLSSTPVSSGSTTVSPTNDDISIVYSDLLQQLATGLSGLTTTTVPTFTSMLSRLDPVVASTTNTLNTTLPGSVKLVHTMMLDAQQFLVKEGAWTQTLAALGF